MRITSHLYKKKSRLRLKISKTILRHFSIKYGYEIPYQTKIGVGLKLMHFGGIVVNPLACIGNNVTILKGVTIGSNRRGENQGAPIIGNGCFIGANAAIIGKCTIGENSFIVPNSFINFDVPPNSIVLGNPAKIISNKDATVAYRDNFI